MRHGYCRNLPPTIVAMLAVLGTDPERILRICDWMMREIEACKASLERLRQLLREFAE